jgi:short-subunit dehydrogenase
VAISYQDKVIIITGASSGIGKACAQVFAKHGAKLVIAARNEKRLSNTANELQTYGVEILAKSTDVSNESEVKALMEAAVNKFGQIDALINNAGISMRALFNDIDLEVFKKVMDINFRGTVYCTKYALPHLIKSKGSIVGVSSVAGYKGLPGRTAYSASKFAMQGFLESLRIENRKNKIHVLMVYPGFTASNIRQTALTADGTPQGQSPLEENKLMQPEEVADAILKAMQKKKRSIILDNQGKLLALLNKFLPNWADKLVYKALTKEENSPF